MRALPAFVLAVGLAASNCIADAAPRISEFMAENTRTLADEDGDFSDWIEIFNPDAFPVNLSGYALTDDPLLPQKWVLPSVTIPGGGFLVVFASMKNRANPAGQLHTNFQLNSAGEYLALIAPDGTTKLTEFAPVFPPQEKDRSYGDGPGYFLSPTPGAMNGTPVDGFVKDTVFSVDRGFFTVPFTVRIATATPGAEIRYTTDGSAPTATTGLVATGPVSITTTTVLRAAAFRQNWEPSNVDTQTYIFAAAVKNQPAAPAGFPSTWGNAYNFSTGELSGGPVPADYEMDAAITNSPAYANLIVPALETTLPVLSIAADTDEIFGANGIYTNGRLNFGMEVPASVEFFGPGSGAGFHHRCGLRIHGGDALVEHPKKPLRIYFRSEYGAPELDFPLYANSPVRKFDRLQLRPGGHDGWSVPFGSSSFGLAYHATYIRDVFLRQTEQAQGRLSPHSRFVHLYINGLYWGFYDIHEVPSKDYFKSHVGGDGADWDVVEQPGNTTDSYDVLDGNPDDLEVLLSLCRPASRPAAPLIFDQIGRYLDMDEFIDHMIVMIWAGQNDWMGPVFRAGVNYSRFFNKNWTAGRLSRGPSYTPFLFNSWDAEISMGAQLVFGFTGQQVVNFDFTRVGEPGTDSVTSPSGIPPGPPAEIYHALRSNADFRRRFADRLYKHFFNNGAMTVAANKARLLALRNTLLLPIVPESARWGDVNGVDFTRDGHWLPEMNWMDATFLTQRNAIVISQFQTQGLYSSVQPPAYSMFGGVVQNGFQLTLTNPNAGGGTIFYTLDGTDPFQPAGPVRKKLTTSSSPSKYWIPTSGVLGDTWKDVAAPANIGIWSDGTSAIGADLATTYPPYITTNAPAMIAGETSMYIRIPFTISSAAELASITALTLRMRYDDGFSAWINGIGPITRRNTPPTPPAFNDSASIQRLKTDALIYETFDWTSQIPNLVVGTNYLCIQALNFAGSGEFLISPELLATTGSLPAGASPSAVEYLNPVALSQSGSILSRVRNLSDQWSPLASATFVVGTSATASNLVLSELHYNPSAPTPAESAAGFTDDSDFEYLELYNPTAGTLDLTAMKFIAGITFDFINSSLTTLAPGGRLLIVKNAAAFAARHGPGLPVAGEFEAGSGLSNGGERIALLDATGAPLLDFTYDATAPWPDPPGGSGLSLVLLHPETIPNPANPANWRLSTSRDGSPNADDRTDFATWLAAHGGTGTETGDSDEDGIWNLTEYFLASPPDAPSLDRLPVAAIRQYKPGRLTTDYLTLKFKRMPSAEDVTYFVEFGTVLNGINQPGVLEDTNWHSDGTVTETWRSTLPVGAAPAQFGRVRIVK